MSDKQKNLEALKLAIQTEQEGKEFYSEAAKSAKTQLARETMESLARDEDFHILAIQKFYDTFDKDETWPDIEEVFTADQLKGEDTKTIFTSALKKSREEALKLADDIAVYERAFEFEKGGSDLYRRLRDESTDDNQRKFFDFLYEMEREHADILERSLRFLRDPDRFYQDEESWMFEG
ncbi:MAG: hypothetical protein Kow00108_25760 [Calditrichia bacterium]